MSKERSLGDLTCLTEIYRNIFKDISEKNKWRWLQAPNVDQMKFYSAGRKVTLTWPKIDSEEPNIVIDGHDYQPLVFKDNV